MATAIMAIFFVVDGYGMNAASLQWVSAPPAETVPALYTAQLMSKLGLATGSAYMLWYLGLLPILYGTAMLQGGGYPRWLSLVAFLGGALALAAGSSFFLVGDTLPAVLAFVLSQAIMAVWVFGAGIVLYRHLSV